MSISKLLLPVAAATAAMAYFWKQEAKAATVPSVAPSTSGGGYPPYQEEEQAPLVEPPAVTSDPFLEEEAAADAVAQYGNVLATAYDQTSWDSRDDLAITLSEHLHSVFVGAEDRKLVATFQEAVGIKVDGLYGPATRSALVTYLPPGWKAPPAAFYQGSASA